MKNQILRAAGALAVGTVAAWAQFVSPNVPGRSAIKTEAVRYLFPEQVSVTAGRPSPVTLHFRVAEGLHINSHTPKDSFLIPTTFSIPDGEGVKLDAATYSHGDVISLAIDPKTKLSVYTGEFTIQVRIVAVAGNHLMRGKLRYQACDNNQCMPPRVIDVPVDVIGK